MEEFSDFRLKRRAVTELSAKRVPPIEIRRRMRAVYGDQCVDVNTVRRWVRQFKDGELGFKNKTPIFVGSDFKNQCSVGGSVLKCVVIL